MLWARGKTKPLGIFLIHTQGIQVHTDQDEKYREGRGVNEWRREDGQVDQCGRQHNRRGVEMAERGRSEEERVGGVPFSRSNASLSLPLGRMLIRMSTRGERLKVSKVFKRGCAT